MNEKVSRILFIALDYYHYPKVISDMIRSMEYEVEFYPIEPRNLFFKVTRYVAKPIYRFFLSRYHKKIILKTKKKNYEKIFFITTHFFSKKNLSNLKKTHKESLFIAYHWDSLNQYNYLNTLDYFDKVYSFDRKDCLNLNLEYLPLFASGVYQDLDDNFKINYDIYTIASIVNPRRYDMIDEFRSFCIENKIRYKFHLKVTPLTYLRIILGGRIPKGVSFKSLKKSQMRKIVESSNVVLDVPNHQQSGLTMRVIENLHAGKKVITTNKNILNENFYFSDQIFFIPSKQKAKLISFIKDVKKFEKIYQLELKHWVETILS